MMTLIIRSIDKHSRYGRSMTRLKEGYQWGTGKGRVHFVANDGSVNYTGRMYGGKMAMCGTRGISRWGANDTTTLEEVQATDFGLCKICSGMISMCAEE